MTPNFGVALMGLRLIDLRARRAYPWAPTVAPWRATLVGPDGTKLVVREDGGLDLVIEGGRPHGGIAFDPTATRRTPEAA